MYQVGEKSIARRRAKGKEARDSNSQYAKMGCIFIFLLSSRSKHTVNKRRQMLMRPTSPTMLGEEYDKQWDLNNQGFSVVLHYFIQTQRHLLGEF